MNEHNTEASGNGTSGGNASSDQGMLDRAFELRIELLKQKMMAQQQVQPALHPAPPPPLLSHPGAAQMATSPAAQPGLMYPQYAGFGQATAPFHAPAFTQQNPAQQFGSPGYAAASDPNVHLLNESLRQQREALDRAQRRRAELELQVQLMNEQLRERKEEARTRQLLDAVKNLQQASTAASHVQNKLASGVSERHRNANQEDSGVIKQLQEQNAMLTKMMSQMGPTQPMQFPNNPYYNSMNGVAPAPYWANGTQQQQFSGHGEHPPGGSGQNAQAPQQQQQQPQHINDANQSALTNPNLEQVKPEQSEQTKKALERANAAASSVGGLVKEGQARSGNGPSTKSLGGNIADLGRRKGPGQLPRLRPYVMAAMFVAMLRKRQQSRVEELRKEMREEISDLSETYMEVGKSWLRRVVRTSIMNATSEEGLNLEIVPPSNKKVLFLKVGLTESELKERTVKLCVRVKGIINGLHSTIENAQLAMPKPLLEFIGKLITPGVFFPPDFILETEKDCLSLTEDLRLQDATPQDQKLIASNFLLTRLLIMKMVVDPWRSKLASGTENKTLKKNMITIGTLLYSVCLQALSENDKEVKMDPAAEKLLLSPDDRTYMLSQIDDQFKIDMAALVNRILEQWRLAALGKGPATIPRVAQPKKDRQAKEERDAPADSNEGGDKGEKGHEDEDKGSEGNDEEKDGEDTNRTKDSTKSEDNDQ